MPARLALAACLLLGLSGCVHVHHPSHQAAKTPSVRPGPPPHAPAHGYRHKHDTPHGSVELRFDGELGVYVVLGRADHWFHAGRYFRRHRGDWMVSARLDGGWVAIGRHDVPSGLAEHFVRAGGHPKHRHQKHRGAAKHGY